jgi:hypothetical protein
MIIKYETLNPTTNSYILLNHACRGKRAAWHSQRSLDLSSQPMVKLLVDSYSCFPFSPVLVWSSHLADYFAVYFLSAKLIYTKSRSKIGTTLLSSSRWCARQECIEYPNRRLKILMLTYSYQHLKLLV